MQINEKTIITDELIGNFELYKPQIEQLLKLPPNLEIVVEVDLDSGVCWSDIANEPEEMFIRYKNLKDVNVFKIYRDGDLRRSTDESRTSRDERSSRDESNGLVGHIIQTSGGYGCNLCIPTSKYEYTQETSIPVNFKEIMYKLEKYSSDISEYEEIERRFGGNIYKVMRALKEKESVS